jgi:hypothetical protein
MTSLLSGAVLIGASCALVYPFIPRKGANNPRNEWIDVSVAIAASGGLAIGIGLIIAGAAGLWL